MELVKEAATVPRESVGILAMRALSLVFSSSKKLYLLTDWRAASGGEGHMPNVRLGKIIQDLHKQCITSLKKQGPFFF